MTNRLQNAKILSLICHYIGKLGQSYEMRISKKTFSIQNENFGRRRKPKEQTVF